jgi:hypothetical protein
MPVGVLFRVGVERSTLLIETTQGRLATPLTVPTAEVEPDL